MLTLALGLTGAAAQAQEMCAPEDRVMIVTLSQGILEGRSELTGFAPPRYGATAAYFLYHYGQMSDADALALFSRLAEGDRRQAVRGMGDMIAALLVHTQGIEEGMRFLNPDPVLGFMDGYFHARYAALARDNGATVFGYLAQLQSDPVYAEQASDGRMLEMTLASYTLDHPPADRLEMAQNAEAAGLNVVAGMIYATLDDGFAEYEAFQARMSDPDTREMVQGMSESVLFGERSDGRYLFELRVDPNDESIEGRVRLARAMEASLEMGRFGWLSMYINMSGDEMGASRAADIYLNALEAGVIDPWTDMEGAWIYMYFALGLQPEAPGLNSFLSSFDVSTSASRHFSGRALDLIERMLVLDALMQDGPPWSGIADHPLLLRFQPVLAALLADPAVFTPSDELEAQIAIDLLWRNGQREAAMQWAAVWLEPQARLDFFRDVAQRLDMTCDGVLAYPGMGIYLGGQPIYRFPAVPRAEWEAYVE